MSVIKVKNESGQFVDISAIQGPPGPQGLKGDIDEQGSTEENVDIWINLNRDAMGILTKISDLIYDNGFINSGTETPTIAIMRGLIWL